MIYHYSDLSHLDLYIFRIQGCGLGNLLFPISRALLGSFKHGGIFVQPTMRQIKPSHLIRHPSNARFYSNIFKHRKLPHLYHWFQAMRSPRFSEDAVTLPLDKGTIIYKGNQSYFHDLNGSREIIYTWLTSALMNPVPKYCYDIAIHVRLGDFRVSHSCDSAHSVVMPLDWYKDTLIEAKRVLGILNPKVLVFTDSPSSQLRSFTMSIPNAELCPSNLSPIATLFAMSQSKLIICSRSTFSMWAAYLGDSIAMWDHLFDYKCYFPHRDGKDIVSGSSIHHST